MWRVLSSLMDAIQGQPPTYSCTKNLIKSTMFTSSNSAFFSLLRFSDALSYMLSCKVMQKNRNLYYYGGVSLTSSEQQLTNIATYRKKFVLLLAKAGKISQALNVLTLPISTDIPKDVMTKTAFKGEWCTVVAYNSFLTVAIGLITSSCMGKLFSTHPHAPSPLSKKGRREEGSKDQSWEMRVEKIKPEDNLTSLQGMCLPHSNMTVIRTAVLLQTCELNAC